MNPLRIAASDAEAELFIVESEDDGIFLAYQPAEPFDDNEPGLSVCIASPETAIADLRVLMDAVASAILELMARQAARQEAASC